MEQLIIAITGPSGIGKTTLGNNLRNYNGFVVPIHSTTRSKRIDDEEGFYRYLTHREFSEFVVTNQFFLWSGDDVIVNEAYGNFYGILNKDFGLVADASRVVIYVSYKDIGHLNKLISMGLNIKIVNLVYSDLEGNMSKRLMSAKRMYSEQEINKRITNAVEYEDKYGDFLSTCDTLKLYGDIDNSDVVYEKVLQKILLR